MSSLKNEDQEELEALGKAVRAFARFEIKALARKMIYQLQRFPASGLFEVRGFKTLWDAFCYSRWVCERHLDRPFLSERACKCGGAGAPCPDCNRPDPADPDDVPAMPRGFVPDLS